MLSLDFKPIVTQPPWLPVTSLVALIGFNMGWTRSPRNGWRSGYLAETRAYLSALTTAATSARAALMNNLILGLQLDGDWVSFDWLMLLAGETEQAGLRNLKNPTKAMLNVNSTTFTVDRGFSGDGISMHLALPETPDTAPSRFSKDNCSAGAWCNQEGAGSASNHVGSGNRFQILAKSSGNEFFEVNDSASSDLFMASNGSRLGHRSVDRSGAAVKRGFFNGTRVADLTTASTTLVGSTLYSLRFGGGFNGDRIAAFWCGASMSDAAHGRVHARLNTFLTAIGGN